MKYSVVAIAALAGVAQAQSACLSQAQAIPPCALGYLASAASSIGQCGLVDFGCQCSNSQSVQAAIQQTVLSVCGGSAADVLNSAAALCSCASANSGQSVELSGAASQCVGSAAAIPPCALGYLASAASSIGQCGLVDFACQCSNSQSVQAAIQQTVLSVCGNSAADVLNSAAALCSCVGGSGGGASGGSGGSASAKPTGSSGGSASGGASSGGSKTGASMASATAGAGSGSGSSSSKPSVSAFTGAAAHVAAGSGIFGAIMGLIAYL